MSKSNLIGNATDVYRAELVAAKRRLHDHGLDTIDPYLVGIGVAIAIGDDPTTEDFRTLLRLARLPTSSREPGSAPLPPTVRGSQCGGGNRAQEIAA